MDWSSIIHLYENSVFTVQVCNSTSIIDEPYKNVCGYKSGSGFIIDIKKGLVITTANLIKNALTITGRIPKLGKRDLSLSLVSICECKNLGLCRIDPLDIDIILRDVSDEHVSLLNLKLGDSFLMRSLDEVMAFGYDVNGFGCSTGCISGFQSNSLNPHDDIEDALSRSPVYIQTTMQGYEGSPLFNKKGEVVGIGLGIENLFVPSRTLSGIMTGLLTSTNINTHKNVNMPTLAVRWCKTNRDLMEITTGEGKNYGIYVRQVYPDSCLDQLKPGDIMRQLQYVNTSNIELICYFDRFGDCSMCTKDAEGQLKNLNDRKLTFAEVVDMIPLHTEFSMDICRDGAWFRIQTQHSPVDSDRISLSLTNGNYEIFAGICCMELTEAHVEHFESLKLWTRDYKKRYAKQIVIVKIFPGSLASKGQSLQAGQILAELNNIKVKTLDDVRNILKEKPKHIVVRTYDNTLYVVGIQDAIIDDMSLLKTFGISNYTYLLG